MENSPPPASASQSILSSYFIIIVATVVLLIIAVTLLLSSCRCLLMESLSNSLQSWRQKKEPKDVWMIPVCRYREEQSFSTECSVCLMAFHEGEKVKQLPACRHSFHAPCVDMWLCSHSSCPSCRALVPQPSSGRQRLAAAGEGSAQQQVEEREAVHAIVSAV